jgi:hypothetical protein
MQLAVPKSHAKSHAAVDGDPAITHLHSNLQPPRLLPLPLLLPVRFCLVWSLSLMLGL